MPSYREKTPYKCIRSCKRDCSPKDCGGTYGFADLLQIIADLEGEEYESMMEWLGGSFDPEAFDLKKTNRFLRKLIWQNPTIEQFVRLLDRRDKIEPVKKSRKDMP